MVPCMLTSYRSLMPMQCPQSLNLPVFGQQTGAQILKGAGSLWEEDNPSFDLIASTSDSFVSMPQTPSPTAHLDCHGGPPQDVGSFLVWNNKRLRSIVHRQRRQLVSILVRGVGSLVREKDEELARARERTKELEACLVRSETEREIWERVAGEKEGTVFELSNALQQVKDCFVSARRDEESCCSERRVDVDDDDDDEVMRHRKMVCKRCNFNRSCFVFLPCRHLCCCQFCEGLADSCPVCDSMKKASMEVLWG